MNNDFRNIDKSTDVLSFPMFKKGTIEKYEKQEWKEPLGDVVINLKQVEEQAI